MDESNPHRGWTSLSADEAEKLLERFRSAALREFTFLGELGYRLVEVRGPILTWQSEQAEFTLWMNPQPNAELYNADIALRPTWTSDYEPCERRFDASLDDIAEWMYSDLTYESLRHYVRLSFPLNHTRPDYEPMLRDTIARLARILRTEFIPVLVNRDGTLDRLARSLARWHESKWIEEQRDVIRPRAQAAFKAGDWQTVIDLYTPMLEHVNRSERMKVDYARRRLDEEHEP